MAISALPGKGPRADRSSRYEKKHRAVGPKLTATVTGAGGKEGLWVASAVPSIWETRTM